MSCEPFAVTRRWNVHQPTTISYWYAVGCNARERARSHTHTQSGSEGAREKESTNTLHTTTTFRQRVCAQRPSSTIQAPQVNIVVIFFFFFYLLPCRLGNAKASLAYLELAVLDGIRLKIQSDFQFVQTLESVNAGNVSLAVNANGFQISFVVSIFCFWFY